jgi:predicted unusual protein kinase regulating ubiquinone biosynthesis (AarF/ABC1/UbiB family)
LSVPFVERVDEKAYYRDFERTIGRYFYTGARANFGELVSVSLNLLREHGLRLNPNLTMAIKALMQAEAIATALTPEGGMIADGVTIIQEEAMQVITADRIVEEAKKQLLIAGREAVKNLPDLSLATVKWMNQYKKGRFEVTVDTSELAKEVDKLGKFGRQVVIAILLVGMLIGSSIATAAIAFAGPSEEAWGFVYNLAYFFFLFAMLITALILLRLVWRWLRRQRFDED